MTASPHVPQLRRALAAGILANLGVALVKFVAFFFTHSTAMLAESVHSVADTSNQILLFVGLVRSARPADEEHPFGYSVERYFWGFVVAVNIFTLGAGVAIYEGVTKVFHPHPIENVLWSYGALVFSALFEGSALRVAWREFSHWRRDHPGPFWRTLREAKDLSLPTVIFEDSAALIGLTVAAVGIGLAHHTGIGWFDGAASIVIGCVLLGVAWFLATESHSLLIGESATRSDRNHIREALLGDPAIDRVVRLSTLQRGPQSLLVALEIEFHDGLSTDEVEAAVRRLEEKIRLAVPAAREIFIEAGAFRRRGNA